MLEELKQKLEEKSEELKSVKAENKDQLEAINKLLQEHEENINKVRLAILLVLRFNDKKCHCYRPQRSCGKVIFSEACVKNSVHGGGGCLPQCMLGYTDPPSRHPPSRRPLPRTARILLECILVSLRNRSFLSSWKRNMNRNVRMKLKHYRKQWKRKKVK